jgi:hypothetical protein
MHLEFATELNRELLDIEGRLNEALRTIQENCSEAEFKRYQLAFGKVMGTLFLDVLEPIYQEHPSLTPPELGGGQDGISQSH